MSVIESSAQNALSDDISLSVLSVLSALILFRVLIARVSQMFKSVLQRVKLGLAAPQNRETVANQSEILCMSKARGVFFFTRACLLVKFYLV